MAALYSPARPAHGPVGAFSCDAVLQHQEIPANPIPSDPRVVQAHMRHSSITLTTKTYGHLLEEDNANLQDALTKLAGSRRSAWRSAFLRKPVAGWR